MQYSYALLLLPALALANPITERAAAPAVTSPASDSFSAQVRADVKSRWPDCGSIQDDFSALYCVNTKLSLNTAAASYAASAQARSDYAYLKPFYTLLSVDAAFSSQIQSARDGVAWYQADLDAASKHPDVSGVAFLTSVDKQILSLQTASPGAGSATGSSPAQQTASASAGASGSGSAATTGSAGASNAAATGTPSSTTSKAAAAPAHTGLGLAAAAAAGLAGLAIGL